MERPKSKFRLKKETKKEYDTKSYRLPVALLKRLDKMVDKKDQSACKIVAKILDWGLSDLEGKK